MDYLEKANKLVQEIEQAEAGDGDYSLARFLLAILYALIGIAQELGVISMWLREMYDR